MAAPARKFEAENDMETRITRLEGKTDLIESTLTDMKARIGRIEDRIEKTIEPKIDAVKDSVTALRVEMKDSFEKLNVGRALDKVWALLTIAAVLAVMARGFKWI